MDGGNLCDAICRDGPETGWYHTGHCIALDVARALSFLHSHGVLHGPPLPPLPSSRAPSLALMRWGQPAR